MMVADAATYVIHSIWTRDVSHSQPPETSTLAKSS
jgi:hypothetical protein